MKLLCGLLALACAHVLLGDVVYFINGDRYTGRVLLVNETEVRLQNEVQGNLTVPRSKVASIQFHALAPTNAVVTAPGVTAGAKGLTIDPAAIEKVQQEVLGTANPEANQIFQELVQGLASGSLNIGDIRAQAQQTLNDVRALQQDLGDDATAGLLDSYVGILENFVRQTTNAPAAKRAPKPLNPPAE